MEVHIRTTSDRGRLVGPKIGQKIGHHLWMAPYKDHQFIFEHFPEKKTFQAGKYQAKIRLHVLRNIQNVKTLSTKENALQGIQDVNWV